jgi:tetratricopeptide (TPR) repeat protein
VGLAAVAIMHSGAWVASLQNEVTAAERVDTLVRQDMHYSDAVRRGERRSSWAAILGVELNRYDLAKDHLGPRATYAPNDATAWANLGSAYRQLNELDSAAACFELATELAPGSDSYLKNLGLLRMWLGELVAARTVFETYVARVDTAYTERVHLGNIYQQLGLPDAADSMLAQAIALQPDRPNAYARLGELAHLLGDTTGAITNYEAALRRGGNSEEIHKRLTQLYQWSGQLDRAVATGHQWEQRWPGSSAAPFVLGLAFIAQQEYDSANAAFERSVARSPQSALGVYYLATTYRHLGEPAKSRELAERAAILDSTLALPYLEMVYLADDAGDRVEAARATRAYLRRSPADSGMPYLRQFLDQ